MKDDSTGYPRRSLVADALSSTVGLTETEKEEQFLLYYQLCLSYLLDFLDKEKTESIQMNELAMKFLQDRDSWMRKILQDIIGKVAPKISNFMK
jgi:hypothetical protein